MSRRKFLELGMKIMTGLAIQPTDMQYVGKGNKTLMQVNTCGGHGVALKFERVFLSLAKHML